MKLTKAVGGAAEWVSFSDSEIQPDGRIKFTGVKRAQLGTQPLNIAPGDSWEVPGQISGVKRQQFHTTAPQGLPSGTRVIPVGVLYNAARGAQPGNHAPGAAISYFANVDDMVRRTVAHEVGHAVGLPHRDFTIMHTPTSRGAWISPDANQRGGIYDTFSDEDQADLLDAQ